VAFARTGLLGWIAVESMFTLNCPVCRKQLSVGEVLDAGTVSSPAQLLFQFLCPRCAAHAVARAEEGRLETGALEQGRFVATSHVEAPDLSVRAETGWLDSWLGGRYRRFPAKG